MNIKISEVDGIFFQKMTIKCIKRLYYSNPEASKIIEYQSFCGILDI